MVFANGDRFLVNGADAATLTLTLHRARKGPGRRTSTGEDLGAGWVNVQTDDGEILVNPDQVAYIREVENSASNPGTRQSASLSGLEGRPVQGQV
jgi:hypothetical protein